MIVLGIESSCDETAAAVVKDGCQVLSSVVFSQIPLHKPYGGVVPEIASRSHLEKISEVVNEAVERSGLGWDGIDAVAVTYGPGLASSLIVGLNTAKGLALALKKPLIGINHIEAHIHSVFLDKPEIPHVYPLLALVVSGGHSAWIECLRPGSYRILGQTLDDAAGEAFDKAAKVLGLGYPGGPVIDQAARRARGDGSYKFPKGRVQPDNPCLGNLRSELCVSFSGLKTSLMHTLKKQPAETPEAVAEVAFAYQEAIVGALADRCAIAVSDGKYKALALGGGVSLNKRLREALQTVCSDAGIPLLLAEPKYCGDNAAMIAGLAGVGGGIVGAEAFELDVVPSLQAGECG